jgi:hypothetical protein
VHSLYSVGRRTCALPYTSRPDEKRSRTRELPFLKRNVALWRVCLQPRTIVTFDFHRCSDLLSVRPRAIRYRTRHMCRTHVCYVLCGYDQC